MRRGTRTDLANGLEHVASVIESAPFAAIRLLGSVRGFVLGLPYRLGRHVRTLAGRVRGCGCTHEDPELCGANAGGEWCECAHHERNGSLAGAFDKRRGAIALAKIAKELAWEYVREGWEPDDAPYDLARFPDDERAAVRILGRALTPDERTSLEEQIRLRLLLQGRVAGCSHPAGSRDTTDDGSPFCTRCGDVLSAREGRPEWEA
jgi:hypothetical protein